MAFQTSMVQGGATEQDIAFLAALKGWLGTVVPAGPEGPPGQPADLPWHILAPSAGAAQINAALQTKSVLLTEGWFTAETTIEVPYGRSLSGQGNGTSLRKAFNGDLIRMGTASRLTDLYIDNNGTGFTGGGIRVQPGATHQAIERVNGTSQDFILKIDSPDDGEFLLMRDCNVLVGDPAKYAVQLPADQGWVGGGIRTFDNIVFGGHWGFDFGGASNTYVNRCNMTGIRFPAQSRGGFICFSRIATSVSVEVRGSYWTLFQNNIQHPLHLMPELNNSDIWQFLGAGTVNQGVGPGVRVHS